MIFNNKCHARRSEKRAAGRARAPSSLVMSLMRLRSRLRPPMRNGGTPSLGQHRRTGLHEAGLECRIESAWDDTHVG